MNYQSRLLSLLFCLAFSGYFTLPVLSGVAQTAKNNPEQKTSKVTSSSKNNKQNSQANKTSTNDDDDDSNDDDSKNPTQSLFEAINVGNLYAAQDALNRGADLHATNVLGQTPLEMSIDLNRDRITFLLLSMRGYNNSPQKLNGDREISTVSVKSEKGYLSIKGQNQRKTVSNLNQSNTYSHYNNISKPEIGFLGFNKS
ncbi:MULTISPECIES: hypothetical protein [unclassified Commensalibacter]|uniref:hypothetical protein n=1 Tax=unclassified Commensalibacter TaxID=2630218 RepID=UPI0018DEB937|nr:MULTISPECIES: hypothetical protein [unclassified Commensalibacter]MBH9969221.1 hypothetical protein [Commensalibacter sp. M0265]MBH9976576.1 hypothetical protein [Commensalibacter sp. M0266]MBH9992487.1 hypothetical protein [Commensalibacter sp. M0270]MBI0045752.1 hypothetical protein [Commensalibacter sp. M0267]MBI0055421.1 hypothetical protein [Commensalibacter sp. M0268]